MIFILKSILPYLPVNLINSLPPPHTFVWSALCSGLPENKLRWDSLKGFKCGNNANWWRMDQLVVQAPNLKFDFGNLAISPGDEGDLCYYEIHR